MEPVGSFMLGRRAIFDHDLQTISKILNNYTREQQAWWQLRVMLIGLL
jgi:hypothetical protein